jgi:hypothetical protein
METVCGGIDDGRYCMTFRDKIKDWSCGLVAYLLSLGFLAIAIGCAVVAAMMIYTEKPWAHVFYSEHPIRMLLGGACAWFMSHLIVRGINYRAVEWKRFAGKLALAAVSVMFSLVLTEVGLRAFLAYRQSSNSIERLKEYRTKGKMPRIRGSNPLIRIIEPSIYKNVVYELQPNLNIMFGHKSLRTNSAGIRSDREYPVSRQPNTIRIVGIGDSGMFGWNTDQNVNYMANLEVLLNKRGDGVLYDTINLAVPGYNTRQEVEMLRHKGLAYKPDIVIVGWCENDFDLPFCMAQEQNFFRRDVLFLYVWMFQRKHFADIALNQLYDQDTFEKGKEAEFIRAGGGEKGVEDAMRDLKYMGENEKFQILIFGPMGKPIVGICGRVGLDFFNTCEKIPDGKYPESYNIHFVHPSADGHRILSEYLVKALEDSGWLARK